MKVLIAPDSFKNALPAAPVAAALARGWLSKRPGDEVLLFPMADGGEGFCKVLAASGNWRQLRCPAHDPLFRPVEGSFLLSQDGACGVVELAAASGIELLKKEELDPLNTTTFGTGELLSALLERGVKRLLVGLGGSATNDGGAGLLQALGGRFYDERDELITEPLTGGRLMKIRRAELAPVWERLRGVTLEAACDVDNPLCGPRGAAPTFAPQKGASPADVGFLDKALAHFCRAVLNDDGNFPGAGAAGGCGFALNRVGASLRPGAELVMETTGFTASLAGADLVITGEGCSDEQTLHGKLCSAVAAEARAHGVLVVLASGALRGRVALLEEAFDAVFSIGRGAEPLPEALEETRENLERMGRSLAALAVAAP